MAQTRLMTKQSVIAIMSKRILIPATAEGKRVKMVVQGNGNIIDVKTKEGEFVESVVEPGTTLQKKIFNARANSQLAMSNPRNQQLLKDALKAEAAGDAEKAHDLYSQYLNAVQFSFGVLLPNSKADLLADGVEIAGQIQKVTTENGSLLTIGDPSTITVVAPESYGATSFDLSMFEDEDEAEEQPTPVPAGETAKQAKVRIAGDEARGVPTAKIPGHKDYVPAELVP